MLEGTATGKGHVYRIKCPKHCGWFREYTKRPEWMIKKVDHLVYGPVTGEALVQLDVINHDCIETANARLRHNRKVAEHGNS